ncbi:MAG: FAD-binding oxidoreductase [Pseudomonadota bacterium]
MSIAVLGAGLIGSAAARHLAAAGHNVTLIGPGEPTDWASHTGVFGSHYDEGRITRQLDPIAFWARTSAASIARYSEIEEQSGISFFREVGGMMAAPDMSRTIRNAREDGVPFDRLTPHEAASFGYHLPTSVTITHETANAGYVSPRRLVAAQQAAAAKRGARRLEEVVIAVREEASSVRVETDTGSHSFDRVLWAAGGFGAPHLDLPTNVQGRTVVMFEVSEAEAERLARLPTLILADGKLIDIYLLPPIRYPDGRTYMKIGGGPENMRLRTEEEMRAWFKSGGDADAARALSAIFHTLLPGIDVVSEHMKPCVTTLLPDDLPAIGVLSERIAVATAGNGRGAKCSDELGRLGAKALLGDMDAILARMLNPGRFA